jgi:hypothetical protein
MSKPAHRVIEAQASKAAAAWLAEVSRPISMAWTLTLVVERLLQLSQGELARLYGQEKPRDVVHAADADARYVRRIYDKCAAGRDGLVDTACVGVEMAVAVMCALNHTEQSQPLEAFLRFATLAYKRLQWKESCQRETTESEPRM